MWMLYVWHLNSQYLDRKHMDENDKKSNKTLVDKFQTLFKILKNEIILFF